jgi:hypothetical protein
VLTQVLKFKVEPMSNQTPIEAARATYELNKREYKRVSFNAETEKGLLNHSKTVQPSFSEWVKAKLAEDLLAKNK